MLPEIGEHSVRQFPGDRGLILGRVITKILKIVLDATLLNTQPYKDQE